MNIVAIVFVLFFVCTHVLADKLLWSDEFNGRSGQKPDSSKWRYDIGGGGWGNQELEYYTDSATNAALDGKGNLVITARKENNNNYNCWYGRCQYTSARILTSGKMSRKYGRIEARIKIPKGNGIWPAFWMLGDDIFQAGWPQCGEIDIMENIGKEPLAVHGTLHGPGYSGSDGLTSTYHLPNNKAFGDDFHVYRADWSTNSVTFSVDGRQYARKTPADVPAGKKWVFDHNFFIILNLAVGGQWPGPPDPSTIFPKSMIIDYVRVFEKSGERNGPIKGVGNRCVDVVEGTDEINGTPLQLYDCNETSVKEWTISDDGSIRVFDKCLHVPGDGRIVGIPVQIKDCNGSDAQNFTLSALGEVINRNMCLEATELTTAIVLQMWNCNGRANQEWELP